MRRGATGWLLILFVIAAGLRVPGLESRPMHGDEAVHAVKFGGLLERGEYRYDPVEYHGPTLYYLTLPVAWLRSETTFAELTERTLRAVPVIFGFLLLPGLLLIREPLGESGLIVASALTAISPVLVYFSRYYIQEILLVCFAMGLIGFGYRTWRDRRVGSAIAAGVCAGLMLATKETAVLYFLAMGLAMLGCKFLCRNRTAGGTTGERASKLIFTAFGTLLIVVAVFFSSFFTNLQGLQDALLAPKTYIERGAGDSVHLHPWWTYLKLLFLHRSTEGVIWSEMLIPAIALCAIPVLVGKVDRQPMPVFAALYALSMTLIFSLIPYKTPWNALGMLHALIILAGFGGRFLWQRFSGSAMGVGLLILFGAGCLQLGAQSWRASHLRAADQANPWVYAHPTTDLLELEKRFASLAECAPAGRETHIEVISSGDDYWPLPWYLRDFPKTGYWRSVDMTAPAAPIIVVSPDAEPALLEKLYTLPPPGERHLYVPLFQDGIALRHGVRRNVYLRKSLYDQCASVLSAGDEAQ